MSNKTKRICARNKDDPAVIIVGLPGSNRGQDDRHGARQPVSLSVAVLGAMLSIFVALVLFMLVNVVPKVAVNEREIELLQPEKQHIEDLERRLADLEIIFLQKDNEDKCLEIMHRGNVHHGKIKRNGFTLIELLVVIAIIALLMSILMPALRKKEDLKCSQAKGNEMALHS